MMSKSRNFFKRLYRKGEKGLTLVELIVILVVSGLLMTAALPFFKGSVMSYLNVRNGKEALQSARVGMRMALDDIKNARFQWQLYPKSDKELWVLIGDNGISQINIYSYVSEDEIFYKGIGPWGSPVMYPMVSNVKEFSFHFFDDQGSELTPSSAFGKVWRVQIDITVGDEESQFTLNGQTTPRMFNGLN